MPLLRDQKGWRMKVKVDEKCCGHARCWHVAPEFYVLDDIGYSALRGTTVDVPPQSEDLARRGARSCPDRVIEIIEE